MLATTSHPVTGFKGRLDRRTVDRFRRLLVISLKDSGFSGVQIAQLVNVSEGTVCNAVASASVDDEPGASKPRRPFFEVCERIIASLKAEDAKGRRVATARDVDQWIASIRPRDRDE